MCFYSFLDQLLDPGSTNLIFWRSDSNSVWAIVYFPSWKGLEANSLAQKYKKNKTYELTLGRYMFGRRIVEGEV